MFARNLKVGLPAPIRGTAPAAPPPPPESTAIDRFEIAPSRGPANTDGQGFSRARVLPNVIAPDEFLYHSDGRYEWSPERYASAWQQSRAKLRAALSSGRFARLVLLVGIQGSGKTSYLNAQMRGDAVYVDDTLTDPELRKSLIAIGREYDTPVDVVWLKTPLSISLQRNRTRPPHRRVREDVIVDEHARLMAQPPSEAEGVRRVELLETKPLVTALAA